MKEEKKTALTGFLKTLIDTAFPTPPQADQPQRTLCGRVLLPAGEGPGQEVNGTPILRHLQDCLTLFASGERLFSELAERVGHFAARPAWTFQN